MVELKHFMILLVSCVWFRGALAGDWCFVHGSSVEYCDWGCCDKDSYGYGYEQQCCEDSAVGMIVGIVIGSVVFVACVVGVIIAICCCMRRNRGRQGQVVTNTQGTTVINTGQTAYGVPATQMAYGQPYGGQPYGGQPAYPMQPVQTSNMAPGTTQQWQPPAYETLNKQEPSNYPQ